VYRYARIEAVDVEVQVNGYLNPAAPSTAYGYDVAIGKLPYNEVSITNPDVVAETTGARHSKGGQYGGSPITVRQRFNSQNALGNPIYGEDAWQTYAQAITTVPTNTNKPVVCVSVAPSPNIGTYSVSLSYTVLYHIEFFDLDTTPLITVKNGIQNGLKPSVKKVLEQSFESGIMEEDDAPSSRRQKLVKSNKVGNLRT